MKATYHDFIKSNPTCSKFQGNRDAMALFDLLNEDENIMKMIDFADNLKPALAGCISEIEAFYRNLQNPTIDLKDSFTKTAVGRMVKTILEPFGYCVTKQKNFPKHISTEFFSSASCYEKTGVATMKIVKRIEPIR